LRAREPHTTVADGAKHASREAKTVREHQERV